jgi:DNA-binding transcriptional LysR family regulator
MIDRLNGVSLFVQVAEAGSFAVAADRVGLSRSAVGKAIARLEERLGTRLFHRTTRSQALTQAGQAYYERCRRVLAELEAAEADIDTGRATPSGRLRVTAPVLIGRRFVAPVLLDLVRQHPGLSLEIAFTDRQADLVEDGIDLAVRAAPLPDVAGLATRRLARLPMVVCATPAYLAARGRPATLEELPAHDLLVYGRDGRSLPWRFIEPDGSVRAMILDGRIRFDDLDSLVEATARRHHEQREQRADRQPVKITRPIEKRDAAPAPEAITSGTTPNTIAAVVIRIGRSRMPAASSIASRLVRPFFCSSLATSTIRMPCLLISPISVTSPTCV